MNELYLINVADGWTIAIYDAAESAFFDMFNHKVRNISNYYRISDLIEDHETIKLMKKTVNENDVFRVGLYASDYSDNFKAWVDLRGGCGEVKPPNEADNPNPLIALRNAVEIYHRRKNNLDLR